MSTRGGGGRTPGDPPESGMSADLSADLASFAVRSVPFDEWVDIDSLANQARLYAELALEVLQ